MKKFLIYGTIVVVIGLIAIYIVSSINHSKPVAKKSPAKPVNSISNVIIGPANQQYFSNNLNIGFNYPNKWNIIDTLGSNTLTATSPAMTLLDSSGQSITGKTILTILNNNPSALSMFNKGSSTAVIESQLMNYSNPSPIQQGSTYLSFLDYAGSGNGLSGIYLTGNYGYTLNQYIPQSNVLSVSPIIYISFDKCSNVICSRQTSPVNVLSNLWQSKLFSGPLLNMLKSININ